MDNELREALNELRDTVIKAVQPDGSGDNSGNDSGGGETEQVVKRIEDGFSDIGDRLEALEKSLDPSNEDEDSQAELLKVLNQLVESHNDLGSAVQKMLPRLEALEKRSATRRSAPADDGGDNGNGDGGNKKDPARTSLAKAFDGFGRGEHVINIGG